MGKYLCNVLLGAAFAITAAAQPTAITGVFNTASYARPGLPNSGIAQGSMIAIFGRGLGPASIVQVDRLPLPSALNATSATIVGAGVYASLGMVYVSDTQVGAVVPSNAPLGIWELIVNSRQGYARFPIEVVASQFGIFTTNQAGSGPAVVQNVNSESDRPVNTILKSARPGQAMILWGTGLGPIEGFDFTSPPVGNLNQPIEVLVAGRRANILYKGRSGCCAAVDQIVFEVPEGVQGCYVPLVVKNGNNISNYTSLSVAANGGACSDPFGYTADELNTANNTGKLNVGSVALVRATVKATAMGMSIDTTTETAVGSFVGYDASQLVASRGNNGTAVTIGACSLFTVAGESGAPTDPIRPRVLDAGTAINLSGPNGAKRVPRGADGIYTAQLSTSTGVGGSIPGLPGGGASASFLTPGSYSTNNGVGGVDVGSFTSSLTIPSNFTWTNENAITNVNRASDLNITWSGIQANGYVFVTGNSFNQAARVGAAFYCLERGSAGRLIVPSAILLGMPPSAVVQGIQTGVLSVGITNEPLRFNARGIDVGVFTYSASTSKRVGFQ